MEEEVWKPAKGYEEFLEVSTFGNARRKPHSFIKSNGRRCTVLACNLKLCATRTGYLLVNANGGKYEQIHRLVALTFIPNPNNLPEVNHKDEDKTNNKVSNLEWCTHQYNSSYGNRAKKIRETLISKNHCGEEILQYTKFGEFVRKFQSGAEAQRITGINNIYACANGKISHAGGYIWVKPPMTYKEWVKNYSGNFREKERIVEKFDKNGNFIEEYRSVSDAARKNNLNISNIASCCRGVKHVKTAGGYIWKYKK